ncbi:hypothetical protein BJ165DRAFT_131983 [Panaeolus papilionaceus]|nr:hypothetical protein BJ165DRAFT_131983 [Panaeolus papilionaceus]
MLPSFLYRPFFSTITSPVLVFDTQLCDSILFPLIFQIHLTLITMEEINFTSDHPVHKRISWKEYDWEEKYPITLPKAFVDHLSRNEALSSADSFVVEHYRKTLVTETENEEDEIAELKKRLALLEESVLAKKKKGSACDVMLAPFRRLPLDILQEIASHCGLKPHWEEGIGGHSKTALKLSATCSALRAVVHNMPSLWQNVLVDFDRYVIYSNPHIGINSQIEHYTRLSRGLPLTIHATDGDCQGVRKVGMKWLFKQWDQSSRDRLQRLIIHPYKGKSWLMGLYNFYMKECTLPNVQTFIATDSSKRLRPGQERPVLCLTTGDFDVICDVFPKLDRLWLGRQDATLVFPPGIFTSLNSAVVNGPFSSMTHMAIRDSIGIEDWYTLLKVLPNLEYGLFNLDATLPSPEPATNSSMYISSRLTHLALTFSKFASTHVLKPFVNLQFPNLAVLFIQFAHSPPLAFNAQPEDQSLSQGMFTNTFPALHTLQANTYTQRGEGSYCGRGFTGLFHLFLAAPSTTTLAVHVSHKLDFLAIAAFLRENQQLPLPNLRVFEMVLEDFIKGNSLTATVTELLLGTHNMSPHNAEASVATPSPDMEAHKEDQQEPRTRNRFTSSGISVLYRLKSLDFEGDQEAREYQGLQQMLRKKHGLKISIERNDSFFTDRLIWDPLSRASCVERWFMLQF